MEEKNSEEEAKMNKLERIIIDCVKNEIDLDDLEEYISDLDEELYQVKGLCVLLQPKVFNLVEDVKMFSLFYGICSMTSHQVRHSLMNLFYPFVSELKNSSQHDWEQHFKMCFLLGMFLSNDDDESVHVLMDKYGDEIFEYIETLLELCDYVPTVKLAVSALKQYPINKMECWLMQRVGWTMAQLDGELVVDWTRHRNVCEVIWRILTCAYDKYERQEDHCTELLNQHVSNRILKYMMRLLDCGEHNYVKVMVILNVELMCLMNRVDRDGQDRLRVMLSNVSGKIEFGALVSNQQFNSVEYQVGWCARWCLDNVLSEDERVDQLPLVKLSSDRFEARSNNETYPAVRSAFAITSGVYYYEVTLITEERFRIGWSTRDAIFGVWTEIHELGDDRHSIAFDILAGCIVHRNKRHPIAHLPAHQSPNVVGCLIDTHNHQFVFYLNGHKIDCQIDVHFSTEPYHATVSLISYQQCSFNFGQSPFLYTPDHIGYDSFSKVTNGDARKYHLVATEDNNDLKWFSHPLVDNQVDLLYRDSKQNEHDNLARQLEHHIELDQAHKVDLTRVEPDRFVQSVMEVMQTELNDDQCIRALLASQVRLYEDEQFMHNEEFVFTGKLFEVIYPYTQMQFNHQNSTKCHNLCVVLTSILNTFPHIPQIIHRIIVNFLLSTKFISNKTLIKNAQLVTSTIAGLDSFIQFDERNKLMLRKNETFSMTLKSFQQYGQIDSVASLYKPSCDPHKLQLGCCAQWLYDQVISDENQSRVREATLSPKDRSFLLKLSSDRLSARSDSDWQSVRSIDHDSPTHVHSDIYYFEVILLTDGPMRIGWATKRSQLDESQIGKDRFSISFDGFNRAVRHQGEVYQLGDIEPWKVGDVIGCLIDKINRKFSFSLNGQELSLPPNIQFSCLPYHAAVSLSSHQQVYFNFGQAPFKYGPQHLDYWDFHLALSYREKQTFKSQLDFRNAKLTDAIISVDSTVTTGNISIKRPIYNFQTPASYFYPNKKAKMDFHQSPLLQIGSNEQTPSSQKSPSISRPHAECRLCTESSTTKLVRFICCPNLILCVEHVKLVTQCTFCAKQRTNLQSPSTSLFAPPTLVSECPLYLDNVRSEKCCLCPEFATNKLLGFVCCSNLILCVEHVKFIPQCTNCV